MNEAWPTVKLGDVVEITSSKRIKMADYVDSGVPFYRSKEIIERAKGNNISTELFILEDHFNAIDKKFGSPSHGDILLTSVGTLGVPYRVNLDDRFYFKDGNLTWFRNYKPNIDDKFFFCWLTSPIAKRKFDEVTIGSTQKALTIISLKSIEIVLPPLAQQKAIASVLGALDDKIENNRQMNETLEEMARAIFKSWFVDFDPVHAKAAGNAPAHMDADTATLFPSSFGDDGLPEDWKKVYLKDFTNIVYGKNLPTKQLATSGYPVFGGNGVIGFHSEYLYEEPQVLVACRGAASGKVIRSLPFSFVTNNSLVIEINSPHLNRFFLELYLKDLTLEGFTTGSAQPQMTIANMDAVKLLDPTKKTLDCFQTLAEPLFDKVLANDEENKTLAELRDTLIPKLMSGEIRVKDAEQEVEAAV